MTRTNTLPSQNQGTTVTNLENHAEKLGVTTSSTFKVLAVSLAALAIVALAFVEIKYKALTFCLALSGIHPLIVVGFIVTLVVGGIVMYVMIQRRNKTPENDTSNAARVNSTSSTLTNDDADLGEDDDAGVSGENPVPPTTIPASVPIISSSSAPRRTNITTHTATTPIIINNITGNAPELQNVRGMLKELLLTQRLPEVDHPMDGQEFSEDDRALVRAVEDFEQNGDLFEINQILTAGPSIKARGIALVKATELHQRYWTEVNYGLQEEGDEYEANKTKQANCKCIIDVLLESNPPIHKRFLLEAAVHACGNLEMPIQNRYLEAPERGTPHARMPDTDRVLKFLKKLTDRAPLTIEERDYALCCAARCGSYNRVETLLQCEAEGVESAIISSEDSYGMAMLFATKAVKDHRGYANGEASWESLYKLLNHCTNHGAQQFLIAFLDELIGGIPQSHDKGKIIELMNSLRDENCTRSRSIYAAALKGNLERVEALLRTPVELVGDNSELWEVLEKILKQNPMPVNDLKILNLLITEPTNKRYVQEQALSEAFSLYKSDQFHKSYEFIESLVNKCSFMSSKTSGIALRCILWPSESAEKEGKHPLSNENAPTILKFIDLILNKDVNRPPSGEEVADTVFRVICSLRDLKAKTVDHYTNCLTIVERLLNRSNLKLTEESRGHAVQILASMLKPLDRDQKDPFYDQVIRLIKLVHPYSKKISPKGLGGCVEQIAKTGYLEIMRIVLKTSPTISVTHHAKSLWAASEKGRLDIVKLLLQHRPHGHSTEWEYEKDGKIIHIGEKGEFHGLGVRGTPFDGLATPLPKKYLLKAVGDAVKNKHLEIALELLKFYAESAESEIDDGSASDLVQANGTPDLDLMFLDMEGGIFGITPEQLESAMQTQRENAYMLAKRKDPQDPVLVAALLETGAISPEIL